MPETSTNDSDRRFRSLDEIKRTYLPERHRASEQRRGGHLQNPVEAARRVVERIKPRTST